MAETRSYSPGRGIWKRIEPKEAGFDSDQLQLAVTQAIESEIKWPHDLNAIISSIDRPPYNKPLGPVMERGTATGLVVKNGYQVASWGDPERADMTFSATKSFISLLIGLAVDRGLIKSADDLVQGGVDTTVTKGDKRAMHTPGSYWEYNDVRVNALALAALYVFKKPLPRVLAQEITESRIWI